MKFGKSIRLESNLHWNTKWTDHYLDYKTFKKLINRLAEMNEEEIHQMQAVLFNDQSNLPRKLSIVHTVLGLPPSPTDESTAAAANEVPTSSATGAVNEAPAILIPSSSENVSATELSKQFPKKGHLFEPTLDFRKRCFQELFRREFIKVDMFCRQKIMDLTKKAQNINEHSVDAHECADKRKKLLTFSLLCSRLLKFIEINFTGLEKVVKKFDKRCSVLDENPSAYKCLVLQAAPEVEKRRSAHLEKLAHLQNHLASLIGKCGRPTELEEDEVRLKELEETVFEDDVPTHTELNLEALPAECISNLRIIIHTDGMGAPITVPVIVAKGAFEGPVLGITSALHGNELNGIPLIFRLIRELDVEWLHGTVVAIPVLNPPGFVRHQRYFHDGQDLNRLFPGNPEGNCGQVYVHKLLHGIIRKFDYNIDLHTASFRRINSLYVRADMNNRVTYNMALLQESQIIVHNTAPDGSMRSAAMKYGIPAITVEIGDPSSIHREFVGSALLGVENLMVNLHMVQKEESLTERKQNKPVLCSRSFWIYSQHGGLLTIRPAIATWVSKGEVIAQIRSVFGAVTATYRAPQDGIIVGKSVDPVCATGDRLVHLGIVESSFPLSANDGHT